MNEIEIFKQEWADYDEKAKVSVGVYELSYEFQKL